VINPKMAPFMNYKGGLSMATLDPTVNLLCMTVVAGFKPREEN
jgi:hypothetical protein